MKTFRIGLRLGVLAGLGAAIYAALKTRRPSGGDSRDATGVHGDWPAVTRRPPEASGDHHPHGRVAVPMEAAAMGAPPAVSDPVRPRAPEPEVPVPAEQLDRPDPHPGSLPHVSPPAPPAPPAPAPVQPKAVAPVKKAAPRKAAAKKAATAKKAAPTARAAPPAAKKAPAPAPAAAKPAKAAPAKTPPGAKSAAPVRKKPPTARG